MQVAAVTGEGNQVSHEEDYQPLPVVAAQLGVLDTQNIFHSRVKRLASRLAIKGSILFFDDASSAEIEQPVHFGLLSPKSKQLN